MRKDNVGNDRFFYLKLRQPVSLRNPRLLIWELSGLVCACHSSLRVALTGIADIGGSWVFS